MRASLLLLLVLISADAVADEGEDRLAHFRGRLQTLTAQNTRDAATDELGTLQAWLDDAERALRQNKTATADRTLDRISAQARLIEALLGRAEAVEQARQAAQHAEVSHREALRLRQAAWLIEQELAMATKVEGE